MSNYCYIISETLLQRTKAETIQEFYPKFIAKYPNWKAIVRARKNSLSSFLKPIGLYNQRAVRLKRLASEMVLLNGRLPSRKEDLNKIPFFGQYISNSVLLLIFNEPAPLLDVNMARVLERVFGKRRLADMRYDPYIQELSQAVVQHRNSKELNWAILDFAAKVCKPKPKCLDCPLNSRCSFFKSQSNER